MWIYQHYEAVWTNCVSRQLHWNTCKTNLLRANFQTNTQRHVLQFRWQKKTFEKTNAGIFMPPDTSVHWRGTTTIAQVEQWTLFETTCLCTGQRFNGFAIEWIYEAFGWRWMWSLHKATIWRKKYLGELFVAKKGIRQPFSHLFVSVILCF